MPWRGRGHLLQRFDLGHDCHSWPPTKPVDRVVPGTNKVPRHPPQGRSQALPNPSSGRCCWWGTRRLINSWVTVPWLLGHQSYFLFPVPVQVTLPGEENRSDEITHPSPPVRLLPGPSRCHQRARMLCQLLTDALRQNESRNTSYMISCAVSSETSVKSYKSMKTVCFFFLPSLPDFQWKCHPTPRTHTGQSITAN